MFPFKVEGDVKIFKVLLLGCIMSVTLVERMHCLATAWAGLPLVTHIPNVWHTKQT